ncbi:hypothetical protein AMTRI_Chr08g165490 [Amborella trichopoda]
MSSYKVKRFALKVSVKALRSFMILNRASKTAGFCLNPPSWVPCLSSSNCISWCTTRSCRSALPPATISSCQP